MSLADDAVADLGAALGLDPAALADRAHVALAIEGLGDLHLERQEEEVLLYLARPIDVGIDRLALYRAALRAVHFENGHAMRMQCGLGEDSLVFLARHRLDEVDGRQLEASLAKLAELHDQVRP